MSRVPTHIIDVMATFVELSGAKYPKEHRGHDIRPMEGTSFAPLLRGASTIDRRQPPYWELEGNRAMRDGDWKLVGQEGQPWELYNLARDRTELRNLASAESNRVAQMSSAYETWAQRCGVGSWQELSKHLSNLPPAAAKK